MITFCIHFIVGSVTSIPATPSFKPYDDVCLKTKPLMEPFKNGEQCSSHYGMFTVKILQRDEEFFKNLLTILVLQFLFLPKDIIITYTKNFEQPLLNWGNTQYHQFEDLLTNDFYRRFQHD